MNRQLVHEYQKDWRVDVKLCQKGFTSLGKFTPLPKMDIVFEFKTWYEVVTPRDEYSSLSVFKLKLEKLYGFNVRPSLGCDVEVSLRYGNLAYHVTDTPPLMMWDSVKDITVETMSRIHFKQATHEMYKGSDKSKHHRLLELNPPVLKCSMKFYLNVPLSNICVEDASKPSIFLNDFKHFFNTNILSDVVFKVDNLCIQAHKVILAAHSPVFRTMLTHDYLESKTNCIEITDSSYAVFKRFIKYFYFKKIEDSSYQSVAELLVLSDKYDVSSLKDECACKLLSFMTVDTICEILISAFDFNNEKLKSFAVVFASVYFENLRSKKKWKALVESHPMIAYEVVNRYSAKE